MSKVNKYVQKIIKYKDSPVYIIFYLKECPYCHQALDLLRSKNLLYKGYDLTNTKGGSKKIFNELSKAPSDIKFSIKHNTVPIIFFQGRFIGGYTELKQRLKSGVSTRKLSRKKSKRKSKKRKSKRKSKQ